MEIISSKIFTIQEEDVKLECINSGGAKTYRIEEIPLEETRLGPGQALIPVAHFHKEMFATFGVPFFLKITDVSVLEKRQDSCSFFLWCVYLLLKNVLNLTYVMLFFRASIL